ncbi:hypothetical protein QTG56_16170 [Rossellomorea sp. AcN35-11]|nr:hypothetical protein [Rossellomorea aquimaris]WJV28591.1 hypothetical protein QTG56_16170 [Rossellomorea sp. AcN35-11]
MEAKFIKPKIRIIGVQIEACPAMLNLIISFIQVPFQPKGAASINIHFTLFVTFSMNNNSVGRDVNVFSFDWNGLELPEDLMFYQNDKCVSAGYSHEGFFMVDETLWNSFLLSYLGR